MPAREVLRMGHPVLQQRARAVEETGTVELRRLVSDMKDTMAAENSAGLAAPQIGVPARVLVFGGFRLDINDRDPPTEDVPFTVLVNPTLTILTRHVEKGWEGCLSVPGLQGEVLRYTKLRYTGTDEEGNPIDRVVEGFHARLVQHECDHLDGILFPQRIQDLRAFGFTEVLFPAGVPAGH